jgi:UDP-N-acetylglucosamine transferase subunit ALG13
VEEQVSQLLVLSIQQRVVVTAQQQIQMEEMDHHQVELELEVYPALPELVGVADLVVAMWVNQFKELVHSPITHHSISDRNVPECYQNLKPSHRKVITLVCCDYMPLVI